MKSIKNILFSILGVLSLSMSGQHIDFNSPLKETFGLVVDLRLDEAEHKVDSLAKTDPGNRAISYINGVITSVKLFLSEDREVFDKKREQLEKYIEELETASDEDPQKRRMISEIRLAMAILHAKYQNNIRAGLQFYKAYNLLEANYKKFPDYTPTYVPLGVLNAAIGSLPEGYQSIASLFGISGSVEEGMKLINKGYWRTISDKDTRFYREYLASVYCYAALKIQGRKDVSLESLGVDYSKSSYLTYIQCLVEVEKGNAEKALSLLVERPDGDQYFKYDYLDYYTGKIAVAFSTDTARHYFNKFLSETKEESFKKSAYRYLSWCAMLDGDAKEVKRYRELVLAKGNLNTSADKQAQKEATGNLNEVLIRGRILFDGGRYKDAIALMQREATKLQSFTSMEVLEYHYRLGRIYQEDQSPNKAIAEFEKALKVSVNETSFAQGNSALQLGVLYETKKQSALAKKYYKRTLTIQGFPFYEGLHQKAKSGLDRLK